MPGYRCIGWSNFALAAGAFEEGSLRSVVGAGGRGVAGRESIANGSNFTTGLVGGAQHVTRGGDHWLRHGVEADGLLSVWSATRRCVVLHWTFSNSLKLGTRNRRTSVTVFFCPFKYSGLSGRGRGPQTPRDASNAPAHPVILATSCHASPPRPACGPMRQGLACARQAGGSSEHQALTYMGPMCIMGYAFADVRAAWDSVSSPPRASLSQSSCMRSARRLESNALACLRS